MGRLPSWEPGCWLLDLAAYWLCDLRQRASPLWTSGSSSVNQGAGSTWFLCLSPSRPHYIHLFIYSTHSFPSIAAHWKYECPYMCTVRQTDRQTDRHTHTSSYIQNRHLGKRKNLTPQWIATLLTTFRVPKPSSFWTRTSSSLWPSASAAKWGRKAAIWFLTPRETAAAAAAAARLFDHGCSSSREMLSTAHFSALEGGPACCRGDWVANSSKGYFHPVGLGGGRIFTFKPCTPQRDDCEKPWLLPRSSLPCGVRFSHQEIVILLPAPDLHLGILVFVDEDGDRVFKHP